MTSNSKFGAHDNSDARWYDLFSRGARDWLRHNEKVRASIRAQLPDLLSRADIVHGDGTQRLRVPVRFLEHYRFKLATPQEQSGVGQGAASPGDQLRPAQQRRGHSNNGGGNDEGGIEFVLELTVEDIVEWLWEELELPNLKNKQGAIEDDEYAREGWNRRGARSRLDRRRSLKESIKRRAVLTDAPAVTDDDLRFRQLVKRQRPSVKAVVFFVMDVSASMTTRDRQLAKTFFFWVVQGLRRQYTELECEFVAHTDRAWRFDEQQFFEVKGSGGTVASSAFDLVGQTIDDQYPPARYNIYLFYASDGDNFAHDADAASASLARCCAAANYSGFVETAGTAGRRSSSEMGTIFAGVAADNPSVASFALCEDEDVWAAIRAFFQQSAQAA